VTTLYLSVEQVRALHQALVGQFGGASGVRDARAGGVVKTRASSGGIS